MYVLVVVQELVSYADDRYDPPPRTLESYEVEELVRLTQDYQPLVSERARRQALNEGGGVYIAANLTEEILISGFSLGDSNDYGGYKNHPLTPQIFYSFTLRGKIPGTDTPIFSSSQKPIGEFVH